MDELDAADVEAARRLVEDEQAEVAVELAGDDDLLLVAARQRAGRDLRGRRPDVVLRDRLRRRARRSRRRCGGSRGRTARGSSRSGRGCRRPRTRGRARTGGGPPGRSPCRGWSSARVLRFVTSWPSSVTVPSDGLRSPTIASTSSSWPLPATPAMPKISPARISKSTPADDLAAAVVADLQARRPSGGRRPDATRRGRRRAGRRARPSARRGPPRRSPSAARWPTTLPRRMTVIRSAISRTSYSLWLMKTMLWPSSARRRRTAKISSVSWGVRTAVGSSRTRTRALPVEGLEDLDPLLPADRQLADLDVRVDLEPEPLAELDDPPARLLPVEEDRVGHRLLAEEDVLGDGQDRDQHEVLVDHVDPAADRVRRARRSGRRSPSMRISPSSGRARP